MDLYYVCSKEYLNYDVNYSIHLYNIKSFDILTVQNNTQYFYIIKIFDEYFNVVCNYNFLYYACMQGNVKILEWYKKSNLSFYLYEEAMVYALQNNRINVLDWFVNNGYEIKFVMYPEFLTSITIDTLEWLKNKIKNLNYEYIISKAIIYNLVNILEWVKNSNYNFNNYEGLMDISITYQNFDILKWFKKNNYNIIHNKKIIETNIVYHNNRDFEDCYDLLIEQVNIIKMIIWYKKYNYKLKFTQKTIYYSFNHNLYCVLNYLKSHGFKHNMFYIKKMIKK
jgi:hypothetical protein